MMILLSEFYENLLNYNELKELIRRKISRKSDEIAVDYRSMTFIRLSINFVWICLFISVKIFVKFILKNFQKNSFSIKCKIRKKELFFCM